MRRHSAGLTIALLIGLAALASGAAPPRFARQHGTYFLSRQVSSLPGVYYIRTGDTLYVRGAISATKDIAQKYRLSGQFGGCVDPGDAFIVGPTVANTVAAYGTEGKLLTHGTQIDAAPINTVNCSNIGGSHGLLVPVVRSVGHSKTAADLGSKWWNTDHTYRFMLVDITGEYLTFFCVPLYAGANWSMKSVVGAGPMAHAEGATDTTAIVVTSQVATNKYPVILNKTITVTRPAGSAVASGDAGYAAYLDITENYDVVDPASIDTTQTPGEWAWDEGVAWYNISNRWRCKPGVTELHTVYTAYRTIYMNYLHVTLAAPITAAAYDDRFYHIPKAKNWGFLRGMNSSSTNYTLVPDSVVSTANPPDRVEVAWKETEAEQCDIGFSLGFAQPALQTTARLVAGTYGHYFSIESAKIYPNYRGMSYDPGGGDVADLYAFRQWFDPSQYATGKMAYWNAANQYGDDVVYLNYHAAFEADTTVLPQRMWGKTVTVLDTLNVTGISATVPASGILCQTTPGNTYGFAVLRLQ